MGNLTQSDMKIVLILVAIIAVLLVVIAILDIIGKKKKKEEVEFFEEQENQLEEKQEEILVETEQLPVELPVMASEEVKPFVDKPNHVQEIKYVEEDEELEKTKARISYLSMVIEYNIKQIELLYDSGQISVDNLLNEYSP